MGSAKTPRVVLLTRPTPFQLVIARHGTVQQAAFFLEQRDQSIETLRSRHERQQRAVQSVSEAIPLSWRRAEVDRGGLDRFLFEDDDIVVAVGQDGLVANAAKYLAGQRVIGINPDPTTNAGVLVPHPADACADLLADVAGGRAAVQRRTMVEAQIDGGFKLRALNEIFVGHCSHQSARYRIRWRGSTERHSSSGVVVSTGTGSTGWARSIQLQRGHPLPTIAPEDRRLQFFVREAFPSPGTDASMTAGLVEESVEFVSEMNEGGVIFGDGIEADRIEFGWGRRATVGISPVALNLVE